MDIRITPPVLRSSRPVHTAAADFSTQRSLPPHLTNPIFTPVQRTGPFYAGAVPYPAAADPLYGVLRIQQSLSSTRTTYAATYGSGPSLLRSTQQSLFLYAAYSSHSFSTQHTATRAGVEATLLVGPRKEAGLVCCTAARFLLRKKPFGKRVRSARVLCRYLCEPR